MKPLTAFSRWMLWIGCCLAFASGSAGAVAILETARQTQITAVYVDPDGNPYPDHITDVDPLGFGVWSSSLNAGTIPASASQASLIDPQELSGSGSVSMTTADNYADTRYHVVFSLGSDTRYSFAVDNVDAGFPFPQLDYTSGFVRLRRVEPGDYGVVLQTIHSISLGRDGTGEGLPDFAADGLLGPGTYAFDFRLTAPGSHQAALPAAAGFLLLIPEPGTFVLVSAGLTLLALRRPRRKC